MILECFTSRSIPYNYVRLEETDANKYVVSWGQRSNSLYPEHEFSRKEFDVIADAKAYANVRRNGFIMPELTQRKIKK